jgi:hypothetical protein
MPEERDDRQGENQLDAWERALSHVVESGHDPATVVFKREDRRGEYVQFYLHNQLFHGEVGSREWGSDGHPLPPEAVRRLAALGYLQTDAHPNYVRDGLPPDPVGLAKLALDLFRAAYDVPQDVPVKITVNLDPEAHTRSAAQRAEESRAATESETSPESHGPDDTTRRPRRPLQPWQAVLPPGHICRIDDLAYQSVGEWYEAHRGRVPVQAAGWLSAYMKTHNCSFAAAFAAATGHRGPLILIH